MYHIFLELANKISEIFICYEYTMMMKFIELKAVLIEKELNIIVSFSK